MTLIWYHPVKINELLYCVIYRTQHQSTLVLLFSTLRLSKFIFALYFTQRCKSRPRGQVNNYVIPPCAPKICRWSFANVSLILCERFVDPLRASFTKIKTFSGTFRCWRTHHITYAGSSKVATRVLASGPKHCGWNKMSSMKESVFISFHQRM